jgi:tripartite-type tricarboxylate transporter receptor subunit TctC
MQCLRRYKKPLYDAKTDFAPVALIVEQQTVLIVRKSLPAANLNGFAVYARTHQAQMQFGSGGVGSATHLACALLNSTIGVATTHVPYRAAGLAIQDMIAGRLDYACPLAPAAISQIAGAGVNGIAMLSKKRSPAIPSLETAAEQGFAIDADTWNALFVPKGTPPQIVQKLNAAAIDAMNTPDVQERLKDMGANIVTPDRRSPEYLAAFISGEIEKWAAVVKAAGMARL